MLNNLVQLLLAAVFVMMKNWGRICLVRWSNLCQCKLIRLICTYYICYIY